MVRANERRIFKIDAAADSSLAVNGSAGNPGSSDNQRRGGYSQACIRVAKERIRAEMTMLLNRAIVEVPR